LELRVIRGRNELNVDSRGTFMPQFGRSFSFVAASSRTSGLEPARSMSAIGISTTTEYNMSGMRHRVAMEQALQATFERLKKWVVAWEHRLDCWPTFKGTLAAHEWMIYPFFMLLVVIFLLLLPRACRYP
jgi:hypothetical protein